MYFALSYFVDAQLACPLSSVILLRKDDPPFCKIEPISISQRVKKSRLLLLSYLNEVPIERLRYTPNMKKHIGMVIYTVDTPSKDWSEVWDLYRRIWPSKVCLVLGMIHLFWYVGRLE